MIPNILKNWWNNDCYDNRYATTNTTIYKNKGKTSLFMHD